MEPKEISEELDQNNLGTRMKEYEQLSLDLIKIPPHRPFLVRLDGRSFSKFTGGMRKPFDLNFTKAMILTTSDLLTEFSAVTGYTHSDEITIIFKQQCSKDDLSLKPDLKVTHMFDGRVIKILTVMSGYCSARFNYHLTRIINTDTQHYSSSYIDKINQMKACFDARLVMFPEDNENDMLNHMVWRSLFDCERNAVSTYARAYFSQKQVNNKSKFDMIEMLKEKGIDWDKKENEGEGSVPFILKHGCYLKKVLYEKEITDEEILKQNPNCTKVTRTKVVCKTFKIKYDDFYLKLLMNKYWEISHDNLSESEVENERNIGTIDFEKEI